ncbi:MAG: tRNA (adenosine(37)-N6)-dimethylallyltransferase MiaA, partial [Treponema sp.]|nr:tRNA (adenosine(37)-N6)-dimethylallyltransferase MiaA [Treponema sp.]
LEVQRLSSRPLSSFAQNAGEKSSRFRFILIGLQMPREELYIRINARCAEMFRQGLAEEVRALFEAGYTPDAPGLRAIGYREFFYREDDDARGEWKLAGNLDGVEELVAMNSRRYAKRQITFFASIPGVKWIGIGRNESEAETARRVMGELEIFL